MKKIMVLVLVFAMLLPLAALAAETDYKNVGVGIGGFIAARGIGSLIENSQAWKADSTPAPAKIAGINLAAFAVAGCGSAFIESLEHGDSHNEIKSDINHRLAGAAISCGVTAITQVVYHYATRNRKK